MSNNSYVTGIPEFNLQLKVVGPTRMLFSNVITGNYYIDLGKLKEFSSCMSFYLLL